MYTYGSFMLRFDRKTAKFCKAIILQLKSNKQTKRMKATDYIKEAVV